MYEESFYMKIALQNLFFNQNQTPKVNQNFSNPFAGQICFKAKPTVDYVTFSGIVVNSSKVESSKFNKMCVTDLSRKDLEGKRVFVRVDYNVPLDVNREITNDERIKATLDTIKYLKRNGAKIILVSHLGRPKGQAKEELSLVPVAKKLEELTGQSVKFLKDPIGSDELLDNVNNLKNGEIALLENIRFYPGEEKPAKDPEFARNLAKLADVYVNDAFGAAHRAHASTSQIAEHMKSGTPKVAGLLMKKEIDMLGGLLENPQKPSVAIIGGSKISSKIPVLRNLLDKVDKIIVVGAMPFTLIKAQNPDSSIGSSLEEKEMYEESLAFLNEAKAKGVEVILPEDVVVASEPKKGAETSIANIDNIPAGKMGLDIGPKSISKFRNALEDAKTVLWNGPAGLFEEGFADGSNAIAEILRDITENGAVTVIGGGDTATAIKKSGISADSFSHISTGGGASIEFLEGKPMPGVEGLDDK